MMQKRKYRVGCLFFFICLDLPVYTFMQIRINALRLHTMWHVNQKYTLHQIYYMEKDTASYNFHHITCTYTAQKFFKQKRKVLIFEKMFKNKMRTILYLTCMYLKINNPIAITFILAFISAWRIKFYNCFKKIYFCRIKKKR